LAAGCTVVQAEQVAPLSAYLFASIVDAAGLLDGVYNLIAGQDRGREALVTHPGVDMVSFTGSTRPGAGSARSPPTA
jgi:aldehyde dehydrogenase (NAD+)